ncbi:MAG: RDD family protein [Prolixibacteraceae bacterium]|nr:RDD family protein [Prolixibacteraceae bacterium]
MLKKLTYLLIALTLLAGCGSSSQSEMKELRYSIGDSPDMTQPKAEKAMPEMDKAQPDIEKSLSAKVIGQIAYNNPDYLVVGKPAIIEARLSRNKTYNLTKDFQGTGTIKIDSLELTNRVKVKLVAMESDMLIDAVEPEEQALEDETFTLWTWKVVAKTAGVKRLRIVIGLANVDPTNPTLTRYVPGKSFEISAKANLPFTIGQFVKSYWQWILSTIMIPLLVYLFNTFIRQNTKIEDNRIRATGPSGEEIIVASIWKRFIAFAIDVNILLLLFVLIFALYKNLSPGDFDLTYLWYFLVVYLLYFVLLTYFMGKTIGKIALNLQVVSMTDQKAGFFSILLREAVRLPSCFAFGFLWFLGNQLNRVAWDRVAKTVVLEAS